LAELGGNITAPEQENLVRGRLVLNTIRGTDKGTISAKTLGSERRVAMWQAEVQQGIIVFRPSADLRDPQVRKRVLESLDE
jgi:hypothetical protein